MLDDLIDDLAERLEGLGVNRDEAVEILAELRDRAYEAGYDEGLDAGADESDEDPVEREPWDPVGMKEK